MIGLDGGWIRAWRARNSYTQENLAWELGVKRQTIIGWEKSESLQRLVFLALTAIEQTDVTRHVGRKDIRKAKS